MSHKSHVSIAKLMAEQLPAEVRAALNQGYSDTAYALMQGADLPKNPHPSPELTPRAHDLYGAWREGASTAERYWQSWASLPPEEKEAFERAALSSALAVKAAAQKQTNHRQEAQAKAQPKEEANTQGPRTAATGGERVGGYKPVTEEKAMRVNVFKVKEEEVLRYIDTLLVEYQNEVGDVSKEYSDFQTSGYMRMLPKDQVIARAGYEKRLAEVQNALRWLAIGKTDIEKGFMAVNRSIFRPSRIALPSDADQE